MSFQSIGFILDESTNSNEIFLLEGISGTDTLRISQVPHGKCTIIGDGQKVPRLSEILTMTGRRSSSYKKLPGRRRSIFSRQYNFEQETTAESLERSLRTTLQNCGSNVYRRLGISPYFAVSLIGHAAFVMPGKRVEEKTYTTDFVGIEPVLPSFSEYSIERDKLSKAMVLIDHKTEQRVVVDEIECYRERENNIIFDPLNDTGQFDPSTYTSVTGFLYIMNQWVEDDFIDRSIVKCILLSDGFYYPDYIQLATGVLEPIPKDQRGRYLRSGKHALYISQLFEAEFEQSVGEHLFDHAWLEQYVQNYLDFLLPRYSSWLCLTHRKMVHTA